MPVLALYALLAVTPCAVLYGCGVALDRWVHSYRGGPPAPAPGVEDLLRDLARLQRDARRIESSPELPGRVGRLRTVAAAYDEKLAECAQALGLPPADRGGAVERLQLEAQLAAHGLVW